MDNRERLSNPVRTTDLLKELLADRGRCLLIDEHASEFISNSQAAYWRERDDVDTFCRVVLGYPLTPATRPFDLTDRLV